jgi:RND family efflux transporter MFP subunit
MTIQSIRNDMDDSFQPLSAERLTVAADASPMSSLEGKTVPLPSRETVRRRLRLAAILIALAIAALTARTVVVGIERTHALADASASNQREYVHVVKPALPHHGDALVLPGTLRGAVESPIYARANGYVKRWYADIGTRVREGQLLAELDTPETDQELAQALAQRRQASVTLGLAKSSLARWRELRAHDAVSQQELDERSSAYDEAAASLAAADANVKRLGELESFKRIAAPFAGVVTRRNVDVGDLVDAGNGGTRRALFSLAQTDPLRVYVDVPQAYAQGIAPGEHVVVTQAELALRSFAGTITHTAQAIDVTTRTMQVEVTLPNRDGALMPGAYVQVAFADTAHARLQVPGNALLFRAEGPRVAVVDAEGRVHLRPVVIARDLGQSLEIESGLTPKDRVIVNPGDSLADGDKVIVAPASASAPAPASAPAKGHA